LVARASVDRVAARVAQCGFVKTSHSEDFAHARDVKCLTGVRGAGQRQQRAVQRHPGAQHAQHLHRFVRRAGEHGALHFAREPLHRAIWPGDSDRTVMPAFHEPVSDDLGENHGGCHGPG
jgi:hypothetical protein